MAVALLSVYAPRVSATVLSQMRHRGFTLTRRFFFLIENEMIVTQNDYVVLVIRLSPLAIDATDSEQRPQRRRIMRSHRNITSSQQSVATTIVGLKAISSEGILVVKSTIEKERVSS